MGPHEVAENKPLIFACFLFRLNEVKTSIKKPASLMFFGYLSDVKKEEKRQ